MIFFKNLRGETLGWQIDFLLPDNLPAAVDFQADGDELSMLLDAMAKTSDHG